MQFSSTDDSVREKGYSSLVVRSRKYIQYQLAGSRLREADREDVIQDVIFRIWKVRHRLNFPNVGSWWRYLRILTGNCLVDYIRAKDTSTPIEDMDQVDIPEDEVELVDDLMEAIEDRRRLYRLADDVFLDVPPDLSERARNRRLLAAKMLIIDKIRWQSVCQILNAGSSEDPQVSRSDLDEWVSTPWLIRTLAYHELHWENDRLYEYLLQRAKADGSREWTAVEALAVQFRYRHAMRVDQIVARLGDRIIKEDLIAIFDSCDKRLPFIEIVRRLNGDFDFGGSARKYLVAPGLWHRLVFQYYAHNGLPHRDIYNRTSPAAREAGFVLTMAILNVGLSNGRMFKRMADHYAGRNNHAVQQPQRRIQ